MKKNLWNRIFCAVVLALCLVPGLGMLLFGPADAATHEVLTKKPSLFDGQGFDPEYLSELAEYFDDHFALRRELITMHAAVTAAVFRESAASDIVLGRDGWLYYADTLRDYEGSAPMTDRQVWAAAHTLALIREYAEERGVRFLFTVAPNKNTLYPEHMPAHFRRSKAPSDLDRLALMLSDEGVPFCDLRPVLRESPEPVYYKTDSHWNGYGSALAHDALMRALGRTGELAGESFSPVPHKGDLCEMLYPAGGAAEKGPSLERERTFSYVGTVHGADDMRIETTAPGGSGSLLMFRDSFGNALHADMAESFASARFSRAMPYDLSELEDCMADTLVIEIVERSIPWLASRVPRMPGPVREEPVGAEEAQARIVVERRQSSLPGCVLYQGSIETDTMDTDSPVCLLLGGAVYEAFPLAGDENGFSLHAPEAAPTAVYFLSGGDWVRCEVTAG